ncbi:hypothetical protein HG537_0A04400 [Torulaspora globosa]|uniref:Protein prenylyltransferase n=1 Tax=Torulaspora globosa TaxID=48254 RepID=A0A7H9HLM8_9SACH|nr:hypothetical protein HG537_0A04400 [Torulaspora sp. CBS 2947]
MDNNAPLCKELYNILLLNPDAQEHRLTFGSNHSCGSERYLIKEDDYMRETFCPTSTLLSVFKESHDILAKCQYRISDYGAENLYFLTLGNLLAAPGNHTAFNLHEKLFIKNLKENTDIKFLLRNELLLIERFLTSTNNRLNKCSSLWYFYRKLVILARYHNCEKLSYSSTIIYSGSRHFSNYYCWATARWLYDIISAKEKASLLEAVSNFCFENVRDISSWTALSYMVCQQKRKLKNNYMDYKRLRKLLQLPEEDTSEPDWLHLEIEQYVAKIIKIIDSAAAEEWPPYLCLMEILKEMPGAADLSIFSTWHLDLRNFEEKYGTINLVRNHPVVPSNLCGNALLSRNARHYGLKKVFLLKVRNFN